MATVQFFDLEQEEANPYNGSTVWDAHELGKRLEDARRRGPKPFLIRLAGTNGYELGIGLGDAGFVQYLPSNGDPPVLLATRPDAPRLDLTAKTNAYEFGWKYDDEHGIISPDVLCGVRALPPLSLRSDL